MANYYSEKSKISINQLIESNLDLVKKIAWQIFGRVQKVRAVEKLLARSFKRHKNIDAFYDPHLKNNLHFP